MSNTTNNNPTNNKKRTLAAALIIAAVVAFIALLWIYQARSADSAEYRLPVYATSDIHGNIISELNEPYEYNLAYIADKVDDARWEDEAYDTDKIILIDGGDIFQGSALSLLTEGEVMSAAFDAMQYDAVAVGNHEFDWGLDAVIDEDATLRGYTLNGREYANDIPVVCCNLYKNGEKTEYTRDYVILEKTASDDSGKEISVKVAVIGFADDYSGSIKNTAFSDLGYSIETDYDAVNDLASGLENSGKCDAVILLAHGAADAIAEALGSSSCIDLVIGGHTHMNLSGTTDWGLRYLEPAGQCSAYLHSDLVFKKSVLGDVQIIPEADDSAGYEKVYDEEDKLYDTEENSDELDRSVVEVTSAYIDSIKDQLEEEIGYITTPVTKEWIDGSDERANTAVNWINDAMRRAAGADVSFLNSSGVRGKLSISEGKDRRSVTLADMFTIEPFDNLLYVYEITYEELLELLDYSMNSPGRGLFKCVTGIDCYFKTDPEADLSQEYPPKIVDALVMDGELIYHDGRWKDGWKEKTLTMATSDYLATTDTEARGAANPLIKYNDTDKLISSDRSLRDAVIEALAGEAAENDGYLHVDTETHFIYGDYDGDDTL